MSNNRYGHIDAIRAIAALSVLYLHVADEFLRHDWVVFRVERLAFIAGSQFLDLGKFGVVLFFGVSGFVIPFSLLNGKKYTVRDFIVSRLFRLYPAYWLSIPFGLYFFYISPEKIFSPSLVFYNISMLQQFFQKENIIGLYWTLQIELIFYFLCVVLFVTDFLQHSRAVFWVAVGLLGAALALAVLRFVLDRRVPVALPLSLSIMFFGMLWRRRLIDGSADCRRYSNVFLMVFVILMPAIAGFSYSQDLGHGETWYRYTITYGAAVAAFVLLTTRWRITSPATAYLGMISYSIYLFGPVMQALIVQLVPPDRHPDLPAHAYLLASVVGTVLFASFTYRLVEQPSILAGRRINAWLDRDARAASPATDVV